MVNFFHYFRLIFSLFDFKDSESASNYLGSSPRLRSAAAPAFEHCAPNAASMQAAAGLRIANLKSPWPPAATSVTFSSYCRIRTVPAGLDADSEAS